MTPPPVGENRKRWMRKSATRLPSGKFEGGEGDLPLPGFSKRNAYRDPRNLRRFPALPAPIRASSRGQSIRGRFPPDAFD
jgi:hypothetical protein